MLSLSSFKGLAAGLLLSGLVVAAPATGSDVTALESRGPGSCHRPDNRRCWSNGFDINTDYELHAPPGQKRHFEWTLEEAHNYTLRDGRTVPKVLLVNGQFPGPTLYADWGDEISVKITNNAKHDGTSFHWHGIHMRENNINDGVNGVTECPLAPGMSKTYHFKAMQYGTTWYHSHYSVQYGDGAWGPIVINGPASNNYDVDLGVFPIVDSYDFTAEEITRNLLTPPLRGPPPNSNNVLFNGTNIHPDDDPFNPTRGEYATVKLQRGKRHRLRLLNPSAENNFQVSLRDHSMTVIATDLVPVNSFTTDHLFIGVGQRYDVLIDASQRGGNGNFWFNVTFSKTDGCGNVARPDKVAAIFRYDDAVGTLPPPSDPRTQPADVDLHCQDSHDFRPVLQRLPNETAFGQADGRQMDVNLNSVWWTVNDVNTTVDWDRPVLDYVLEGNTSYPTRENLQFIERRGEWTFWIIQNRLAGAVPHPMHLHGHDFLVLGSQRNATFEYARDMPGLFNRDKAWTRRDVTMLPSAGWVVLAYHADNPGNWLVHCHIAWHVAGGLAYTVVERIDEQVALLSPADKAQYHQTCEEWRAFNQPDIQFDSGI